MQLLRMESSQSDLPREVQVLTATKQAAEYVMANKHALVEVDRRRQDMRQAARALDKGQNDERVGLLTGSVMFRLPAKNVKEILAKGN